MKRLLSIVLVALLLCGCTINLPSNTSTPETPIATIRVTADVGSVDSLADIPEYSGSAYITVNNGVTFFTKEDKAKIKTTSESYSELDEYGRCGVCTAYVTHDTMPNGKRGAIGHVKPTGWVQAKYDGIVNSKPPYLYNRCHLIGYQLTAENANKQNLITGTRYLNIEGMLDTENAVADYVRNHDAVYYRVTPDFRGSELLARGVLIEAESEDGALVLCVYCYNVQPGVVLDYQTGESRKE